MRMPMAALHSTMTLKYKELCNWMTDDIIHQFVYYGMIKKRMMDVSKQIVCYINEWMNEYINSTQGSGNTVISLLLHHPIF